MDKEEDQQSVKVEIDSDTETILKVAAKEQCRSLQDQCKWILAQWADEYKSELTFDPINKGVYFDRNKSKGPVEHKPKGRKPDNELKGPYRHEKESYYQWRLNQPKITNKITVSQLHDIYREQRRILGKSARGNLFSGIIDTALKERLNDATSDGKPRWSRDDYRLAFRIALIKADGVEHYRPDRFIRGSYGPIWYAVNSERDFEKAVKEAKAVNLIPEPGKVQLTDAPRPSGFVFELWQIYRQVGVEYGADVTKFKFTPFLKKLLSSRAHDKNEHGRWKWSKADFRFLFKGVFKSEEDLKLENVIHHPKSMDRWMEKFEEEETRED